MKRKTNFSKKTTALLIAAALLLVSGTVTGARAAFIAQSDLYKAQFFVNHLEAHLYENGKDVCEKSGTLADIETLGTVDPGKAYDEVIQAKNSKDVDQYVRITIRKYWLREVKDENGNVIAVEKATDLSPSLIKLTYNGSEYNSTDWVRDESDLERDENNNLLPHETETFYYKTKLGANDLSAPLFDKLMIDRAVIPDMHMPTDEELKSDAYKDYVTITEDPIGNTKIYSYSYKYDGYTFCIEADVQALQTHNVQDAIHSAWGVYNVKVDADGNLSVE